MRRLVVSVVPVAPAVAVAVLVVTIGVGTAAPAAAQFGVGGATEVTQLANHAELVATVKQLYDNYQKIRAHLEVAEYNLEKMDVRTWRDLSDFMNGVKVVSAHGKAVAYSLDGAIGFFLENFPANFAMTPGIVEGGERMDGIERYWNEALRDTYAGALGAAAENAVDTDALNLALAELQASADDAEGLSRNLHVLNMLLGHQAQETAKLNQLLSSLINVQAVDRAYTVARRSAAAATVRELAYPAGWNLPVVYESARAWDE